MRTQPYTRGLIMGCFDLLHHGHRKVLQASKHYCDTLVVGLAIDSTVAEVKGINRPVVHYNERHQMLGAMRDVDVVKPFSLSTQFDFVLQTLPNICFAGPGGNPRLQEILDELQLPIPLKILDTEVVHTSDLIGV